MNSKRFYKIISISIAIAMSVAYTAPANAEIKRISSQLSVNRGPVSLIGAGFKDIKDIRYSAGNLYVMQHKDGIYYIPMSGSSKIYKAKITDKSITTSIINYKDINFIVSKDKLGVLDSEMQEIQYISSSYNKKNYKDISFADISDNGDLYFVDDHKELFVLTNDKRLFSGNLESLKTINFAYYFNDLKVVFIGADGYIKSFKYEENNTLTIISNILKISKDKDIVTSRSPYGNLIFINDEDSIKVVSGNSGVVDSIKKEEEYMDIVSISYAPISEKTGFLIMATKENIFAKKYDINYSN